MLSCKSPKFDIEGPGKQSFTTSQELRQINGMPLFDVQRGLLMDIVQSWVRVLPYIYNDTSYCRKVKF